MRKLNSKILLNKSKNYLSIVSGSAWISLKLKNGISLFGSHCNILYSQLSTNDPLCFYYSSLQIKLDQPVSDPTSPREINNGDTAANLSIHIQTLRSEVDKLRHQLSFAEKERKF